MCLKKKCVYIVYNLGFNFLVFVVEFNIVFLCYWNLSKKMIVCLVNFKLYNSWILSEWVNINIVKFYFYIESRMLYFCLIDYFVVVYVV